MIVATARPFDVSCPQRLISSPQERPIECFNACCNFSYPEEDWLSPLGEQPPSYTSASASREQSPDPRHLEGIGPATSAPSCTAYSYPNAVEHAQQSSLAMAPPTTSLGSRSGPLSSLSERASAAGAAGAPVTGTSSVGGSEFALRSVAETVESTVDALSASLRELSLKIHGQQALLVESRERRLTELLWHAKPGHPEVMFKEK